MHFELDGEQIHEIEGLKSPDTKTPPVTLEELEVDCEGEPVLEELLREVVDKCLAYTITVAKFKKIVTLKDKSWDDSREEIETVRTSSHDAMISAVNLLSRELSSRDRDISWASEFGGERVKYARFALTLTLSRI